MSKNWGGDGCYIGNYLKGGNATYYLKNPKLIFLLLPWLLGIQMVIPLLILNSTLLRVVLWNRGYVYPACYVWTSLQELVWIQTTTAVKTAQHRLQIRLTCRLLTRGLCQSCRTCTEVCAVLCLLLLLIMLAGYKLFFLPSVRDCLVLFKVNKELQSGP